MFAPLAIPELFAITQVSDYWQIIHYIETEIILLFSLLNASLIRSKVSIRANPK